MSARAAAWLAWSLLGLSVGAGFLVASVIAGFALLLSWMSSLQLVVFGLGVLIGLPAYLGIPVWFFLLGRHLATSGRSR